MSVDSTVRIVATAAIVAVILVGAVPLAIVAKRIQRHYLGPQV